MGRLLHWAWPRSLQGQLLLAVALALLLAQTIGAALLYRAQTERQEAMLIHTASLRLYAALREEAGLPPRGTGLPPNSALGVPSRELRYEVLPGSPLRAGETRLAGAEAELRGMLEAQGFPLRDVQVARRLVSNDPVAQRRIQTRSVFLGRKAPARPRRVIIAAVQRPLDGAWLAVRVLTPRVDRRPLTGLIAQTLLTYAVLVTVIALILRRITRPLAALKARMDAFAQNRDPAGQLAPEGPDDVRHLIEAHNALELRVAKLLDEKDVMLGAIGHDLKTPLAALRVRIESVENETERARMAATIEDITRSLDDILSLARVGRPSDPLERVDLSALVAQICEEFEDLGEPVTLGDCARVSVPLRVTWLRRALRNLIGNALRYGQVARVSLEREAEAICVVVDDDGPGIPPDQLTRMLEPFTRGDPSRNSATGGSGLGLTLARAIAEQHGGSLALVNRTNQDGTIGGLTARLRLPLV